VINDQAGNSLSYDTPGVLNLTPATVYDFTLHLCVDLTCLPDVAGAGVSGTFNGWTFEALADPEGDGIWCGDVVIPAGSNPEVRFKFRNGIDGSADWETISDRVYHIAHGATEDVYEAWWNDEPCNPTSLELPESVTLAQNYPNPFNPGTALSFTLSEPTQVSLTVCDVQGRRVSTLVNGFLEAGSHTVEFNAAGLGTGVYFYTLQTPEECLTRKMVLMK
jgi:hypothetical protein